MTRRSMENFASAGTVLILPPSPALNTPPTLMVGHMTLPSGVVNVRPGERALVIAEQKD